MTEELDALSRNHRWTWLACLQGSLKVGCKWIYKIETQIDVSIESYKVQLVTKGFSHKYGIIKKHLHELQIK